MTDPNEVARGSRAKWAALGSTFFAVVVSLDAVGVLGADDPLLVGVGSVVLAMTGGAGGDLVVAASTLTVAATFGPLRTRVQGLVDRRFNRARFDTHQTVEAFGHRLRDEVDFETITAEVRQVVSQTLQPASAAVWLPSGREIRSRG